MPIECCRVKGSNMRIAIISDVHANLAALEAIEEPYDLLFCLGDLVDYGPEPRQAIRWVRERALKVVRGNHDHALAYDADCRCAPVMREASVTTRQWHSRLLSAEDKQYLRELPVADRIAVSGATFHLAHAAPDGNLYDYHIVPDAPEEFLREQIEGIDTDFILLGHTHLPMVRAIGKTTIVNPGSVGQPRHGDARASYAVWEDGAVSLCKVAYDVNRVTALLKRAPLTLSVIGQLKTVLESGGARVL
jgi:putative phosphoesterase